MMLRVKKSQFWVSEGINVSQVIVYPPLVAGQAASGPAPGKQLEEGRTLLEYNIQWRQVCARVVVCCVLLVFGIKIGLC